MNKHRKLHIVKFLSFFFFFFFCIPHCALNPGDPILKKKLATFFTNYTTDKAYIKPSKMKTCDIDHNARTIVMVAEGGFPDQQFTEEIVEGIYNDLKKLTATHRERNYKLQVIADGKPIEELVPNALRTGAKAEERLSKTVYKGEPWVKNTSLPYTLHHGLSNRHIALWQSHGNYFDEKKATWKWQRPRLFCTTEDLFSQTFVIPYIIPMLENAGAIVYTPRDRDWQNHEVIVDNDAPCDNGVYMEGKAVMNKYNGVWKFCQDTGFAQKKDVYDDNDNPFSDGTARYIETVTSRDQASIATWMPDIPEDGEYAVYVSYQAYANSVDDASYTVYHHGGRTEFKVNQQMGGGTWVYLGTFRFEKGIHESGRVVLSNHSRHNFRVVSADAVRFGSGMGNIRRGLGFFYSTISGMPRWSEAARYSMQWAGMPSDVYHCPELSGDYRDDLFGRSQAVNYLSGGSVFNPKQEGRKVPLELTLAFHTDAGFKPEDTFVGSLSLYTTDQGDGKTATGIDRYACRDLSSLLLTGLHRDLAKYKWQVRQIWNKRYVESREPVSPSCILEMLSHQNFADMRMGYDPHFKFDFSRSVYKSILRFIATQYGVPYTVQPLPIKNFSVTLDEKKHTADLQWEETVDELEPTAKPTSYIVYTRIGDNDFDNGVVVNKNKYRLSLTPGVVYSFKVCALNDGGKSFPSEVLAAYVAPQSKGKILIVNAFNRLSAPHTISNANEQGFDLMRDPGVPYGKFAGFCGNQIVLSKKNMGSETETGTGYSGSELEGKIVMGNTFDYPYIHGDAIAQIGQYSFTSANESYLLSHRDNLSEYALIDVIYGVQKELRPQTLDILDKYCMQGGRLLISGSNVFRASNFRCTSLAVAPNAKELTDRNTGVAGSGVDFDIYREMNEYSYSVPSPSVLQPVGNAFTMLAYKNGSSAAIAHKESGIATIALGFPFETIQQTKQRHLLMHAMLNYLME